MTDAILNISGMSCQHCVMRVKKTIENLAGISAVTAEVGSAKVSYDETKLSQNEIEAAIEKAGYKINRY